MLANYSFQSRVHPLRTFPQGTYVKREDELGFGVSGSKIRKYRSLIPYFVSKRFPQVAIIGGAYSNHVLGISQLLIENGINPFLYLRADKNQPQEGNYLLTRLMVDESFIRFISKEDWPHVEEIARAEGQPFVLSEGGFHPEAIPGAATLAQDILRNESELGFQFDHIFIDAGTGFMALSLLFEMRRLERQACIHILLLADDEPCFLRKVQEFSQYYPGVEPNGFRLYRPSTAKSFGTTNAAIFNEIKFLAQTEGFLTDPIYSAKLFLESRKVIEHLPNETRNLILHSGGALTLNGFSERLASTKFVPKNKSVNGSDF